MGFTKKSARRRFVFHNAKMDLFFDVTLGKLAARYKDDPTQLVEDLMKAKLLNPLRPKCHDEMQLKPSDPWKWRCRNRMCNREIRVASGSFFANYKHRYAVLVAIYLWSQGYTAGQMQQEAELSQPTVTKLLRECRAMLHRWGTFIAP